MLRIIVLCIFSGVLALDLAAQTSAFTYQGKLNDNSIAGNGPYEMRFRLFDAETGGVQQPQPTPITLDFTVAGGNAVTVTNGVFTVRLDFTAAGFPGAPRFLEISVRRTAADPWTLLDPRQPVTRAPQSLSADGLSDACNLCVTNAQIESVDGSKVSGVVAIANGGTGSSTQNFIDLTTDQTSIAGNKTFSGVLSLSSGSAATPSMTFSGDTDTGFFRSAPDTLRFSTAGVSRMVIDPNGRIGVGTEIGPTPTRFFAVEDNPSASTAYGVYGQAGGTTGFRAGVVGQSIFTTPQTGTTIGYGVYGFASGATINNGLVGIAQGAGTTNVGVYGFASGGTRNFAGYFDGNTYVSSPGVVRAYINSDANAGVALTLNDQPGWSVATANTGHFQIYNDAIGQNALWIDKTTNDVGIGTFTPGAKLDVAGNINTSTQYNMGGNRILGNQGSLNLFAGVNAGFSNGSGAANTFVGDAAGRLNVTGGGNSYFGRAAGENSTGSGNSFFGVTAGQFATSANSAYFGAGSGRGLSAAVPNTGGENAFFGYQSGLFNTSGNLNAFFGSGSGRANTTGFFNAFFGAVSGIANVNGTGNAFFGMQTGDSNISGSQNSFFGYRAGDVNTGGNLNVFLGTAAGQSNTVGSYNTIVGSVANVLADNLEYASAIGAFARVGSSDTIVLGKVAGTYDSVARPADTVQIPGNLNLAGTLTANGSGLTNLNAANITSGTLPISRGGTGSSTQNFVDLSAAQNVGGNKLFTDNVGIGTIAPIGPFHMSGNSGGFAMTFTNAANTLGRQGYRLAFDNDRFTFQRANDDGTFSANQVAIDQISGNVGIGTVTPGIYKLNIAGSTLSSGLRVQTDLQFGTVASFGGNGRFQIDSATNPGGRFDVVEDGRIFIGNEPGYDPALTKLTVYGTASIAGGITVSGNTSLNGLVTVPTFGALGTVPICRNALLQISQCNPSSLRYKESIVPYRSGVDLIRRLRPVTYNWKQDGKADFGLIAEEVEKEEPFLAIYDEKGEVNGVRYDRIGVIAINAIKEQQAQIEDLKKQIALLKALACARKSEIEICKELK